MLNLFSVIILNNPMPVLLKAKGSFELVGFSLIPKKPKKKESKIPKKPKKKESKIPKKPKKKESKIPKKPDKCDKESKIPKKGCS